MKNLKGFTFNTVELPVIKEKLGKEWIYFGGDNLFPNFVVDLYNKSAINRRCIQSKADAILGGGLTCKEPSLHYATKWANPYETWNEIIERIGLDYSLHGGFALNIIWSNDAETIAEVYALDFSKVRSGHAGEDDQCHEYYYSFDWKNVRKFKPQRFAAFNQEEAKDGLARGVEGALSQILYVKTYSPDQFYYPLPDYIGSFNDIQLDISISEFHLSNLSNGLTPSMWINVPTGDPGDEGKREFYQEIDATFAGQKNAGRFFVTFSEGAEMKPEITPLASVNDNYYLQVDERVTSRILTGHGITSPLLLGIRTGSSGLGNNKDELLMAWEHFEFTVIRPMKKVILSELQKIFKFKGYPQIELELIPNKLFQI
jgi:hypothetical protein